MKEHEERELNGEVTLHTQQSPVKPGEETSGEEQAGKSDASAEDRDGVLPLVGTDAGPDGEGTPTEDNGLQGKALPCETAQGALGQVKAKVEVCKDESIGKGFSSLASLVLTGHCFWSFSRSLSFYKTSQNLKNSACTWKNALTLSKSP